MKWTARFGTYVPAHYGLQPAVAGCFYLELVFKVCLFRYAPHSSPSNLKAQTQYMIYRHDLSPKRSQPHCELSLSPPTFAALLQFEFSAAKRKANAYEALCLSRFIPVPVQAWHQPLLQNRRYWLRSRN